ncbi:GlsB/YeaQ/YmgE family stress response membrane protein [Micromonospora sp. NPDC000207]|uniref:GlsB/YeaQ/YmgE family stress response membrane protein n=1 Tax=unclassified Micromonospora TaxID=2617518 RepID=UPI0033340D10
MTVIGIITALIVGLIVGALGRLVVPGRQNMPIWLHMLIGVGAALLGTVLARALGLATGSAFNLGEFVVQVLLAAAAVALVAGVGGRRRGVTR